MSRTPQNRQAEAKKNSGQFSKGKSGNPGGRPKGIAEVKEAARAHTELAITRLAHWANSNEPSASVAACNALLDRAWGKAPTKFEDDDGNTGLTVIINKGD